MKKNIEDDTKDLINEEINLILTKAFIIIEEKEKINQEKNDSDIKFNTISIEEIMSQSNNTNFTPFENNLNLSSNKIESVEPIKINNIEELLLNETQITEIIYTYDKKYKNCFNESNMIKLIDYSTHMPYISDDEIITHKYPFYACELLRCDAPYIYNQFFDNEKIMTYFFEFLNDNKNNSNCVLSGYFAKIFLSLLDKKNDEIINFIFNTKNDYINQIIDLCEDSSYCECIKNLLTLQNEKYNDKKLLIINKLSQKIFQNENFTNKICFEIFSALCEEGNITFCSFIVKNFNKIFDNFKFKVHNLELFNLYKHLVRIIMECFTREKENIDENRVNLNNFVIKNKKIFLDFEIKLINSMTNNMFDYFEENKKNKLFRRILVMYVDILEIIIFSISIKDEKNDLFKIYINKIHDIFTKKHLEKISEIIFEFPLFNMLQISYIELLSTLSKINSPLLKNENIINKYIDYLLNGYNDNQILISTIVKSLSIIYLSQDKDFLCSNKKLKICYDTVIKKIMDIYESKLLYTEDKCVKNEKENSLNNNENDFVPSPCIKDIIIKCISDLDNLLKLNSSSKNLNNDNISEEIDLDDDELSVSNDNDKLSKDKNFQILENYDEIDDEEEDKEDNIDDIIKQTSEAVKSIKQRADQDKNINIDQEKKILSKDDMHFRKNINILNDKNNEEGICNVTRKKSEEIHVLPKIVMAFDEHEYSRYYHRDYNQYKNNRLINSNERINNFRSNNNIFKNKEKKENSLFINVKKSAGALNSKNQENK